MKEVILFKPIWALPFVILLSSIAIFPGVFSEKTWARWCGKISLITVLMFIIPFIATCGYSEAIIHLEHEILYEYIPFILLISALYTAAYGIKIKSKYINGKPGSNTALLGIAMFTSSIMGTTGSSIVFIKPFLDANMHRKYRIHHVIFFIITVSNIGGALTPLGDPPLFLGYLNGIHFFWFTLNLALPTGLLSLYLLTLFFAVDTFMYRYWEKDKRYNNPIHNKKFKIRGVINFVLIAMVSVVLILSSSIKSETLSLIAIVAGLSIILVSAILCNKKAKVKINTHPLMEVAKVFIGIFITSIPVMSILKSGYYSMDFPLSLLSHDNLTPNPTAYYWITGILSSTLDNAPTYMIFFNMASGDPEYLMYTNTGKALLLAISMAAVYMGCLTYIGNAPNLMIKGLARSSYRIHMPSMLVYAVIASSIVIPPLFIVSIIFI